MKDYNAIKERGFHSSFHQPITLLVGLILFMVVTTLYNCAPKSPQTTTNHAQFEAKVLITNKVINQVNHLIFGDNIEWTNNGMGLWLPTQNKFDQEIVEEIRQLGITHLRYPGGTLSDYFEWYNAIGSNRQLITNPFNNMKKECPHFGPEEFILLCKELKIPGTITLNAGTGTPEDAIRWVKYFKLKNFQVTAYAVGNEIYMAKREEPIYKTPQEYIQFYKKCYKGIKDIDPNIKLGTIGLHDTGNIKLSQNENWMNEILSNIGDKIDFIDIHNSYAPITRGVGISKKRCDDDTFALCFMGASEYVKNNVAETKRDVEMLTPNNGENVEIHITEYGPLVYPIDKKRAVEDVAWNRSLAGALYLASLFNVFLREPKIKSANHLPLCQDIFGALIGIRGVYPERKIWRNIVYHVFQAYSRMVGRDVLQVEISSPTYSTPATGIVPKLSEIPYIDAGAYKSNGEITIFLINRSIRDLARVKIEIESSFKKLEKAILITADSYKSENTPEEPNKVVPTTKMPNDIMGKNITIDVPKHSLMIIDLSI